MAAKLKTYGKKKAHGLITAFENITLSPDKKSEKVHLTVSLMC